MEMQIKRFVIASLFAFSAASVSQAFTIEEVNFDTTFGAQTRIYDNDPLSPIQRRHEFLSLYFQQEISYSWNGGKDSWVFTPYIMGTRYEDPMKIKHEGFVPFVVPIPIIDFGDTRTVHRTYGDIREFLWTHIAHDSSWELRTGIGKVFWGVTESQHLIDVINQDDLRADMDREDKLGQPMINLTLVRNWGNVDLFVLPGFRERLYQPEVGRLNPTFVDDINQPVSATNRVRTLDQENTNYESSAEYFHTDAAFRWSHNVGVHDFGIYYFMGTNREPILSSPINEEDFIANGFNANPEMTTSAQYPAVDYLVPYYEQMQQVGIDYQATLGAWLLKFEGLYRDSDSLKTPQKDRAKDKTDNFTTDYTAVVTGLEYTFSNVFDNTASIGLILEYHWDSREFEATTPYQNDVFLGVRYAKHSAADPSILFGVIQDLDIKSYVAFFETSRRLGQSSRIVFEGFYAVADKTPTEIEDGFDSTTVFANEDHLRLAWETFF